MSSMWRVYSKRNSGNIESLKFLTAIQNEYISIKSKYNDIENLITEKEDKIKTLHDEISVIKRNYLI